MKFFILAAVLAVAAAVPYGYVQKEAEAEAEAPKPVIVSQSDIRNLDGSSSFSYASSDNINREESQYQKQVGKDSVTVNKGSVEWEAPDGQKVSMSWIADENGYRPSGSHLPVAPPMPVEIEAMLPTLPKLSNEDLYGVPVQAAAAPAYAASKYEAPRMETPRIEAQKYEAPAAPSVAMKSATSY